MLGLLRRVVVLVGTLCAAFAVGYVMQMGRGAPERVARAATVISDALPVVAGAPDTRPMKLDHMQLASMPSEPPRPEPLPVSLPDVPAAATMQLAALEPVAKTLPREVAAPGFECKASLSAETRAAAIVRLTLSAPCRAESAFTVHHNGMMISGRTDADGHAQIDVPALAATAVFMVEFDTGGGAMTTAQVDALSVYDRVVVQWRGSAGLHLHALENGASYASDGDVWAGAPRDAAHAAQGKGGFLMRLGTNTGRQAEVYTFPVGGAQRDGAVALHVDAQVTAANCGQDLDAQTIQVERAARPHVQDVTLAMPGCDTGASGDYLLLNNLFDNLKIARN